ncbi:MAG TPA: hypothetical protein VHO72_04960 [Bacteroidales bacterium]|nr:hypothetical protein [Bacteroidales bacterium]
MKVCLVLYLLLALFSQALAQSDSVAEAADIEFKEGIYIVFEQVKLNAPLEKSRVITKVGYNDPDFFDQVLSNKELSFYDDNGMKQRVPVKSVWGYAKNGDLYVGINNQYCKVSYLGSISHFIVTHFQTVYESTYDPYYNSNPYYYPSAGIRYASPKTELRQFLINFENGQVVDYTADNIMALLTKDPQLYDEYAALKKKKREQLKFFYIRKFNQRNPLKISSK